MKYDNDQLSELCSKFNLLDYAMQKYDFKKMSGIYYCRCPFHNENTASFTINPDTNKYYCFGCKAKGSPIDFLIKAEHMTFNEAVNKLAEMTGTEVKKLKQCEALTYFKQLKRLQENNKEEEIHREILDPDSINQFKDELSPEWLEEGISAETMKKYQIRLDESANRIVYPVYDANDNLIGFKGRTRFKDFKMLGIAKYMNYKKLVKCDFFEGLHENKSTILSDRKVVIFEGLKSVMKLADLGDNHGLAAETSCLNEEQVKLLIKMKISEINIAFDKGIKLEKIKECTRLLRRYADVYVIIDKNNLLEDKDSPIDRGKDVWEKLYDERIKI